MIISSGVIRIRLSLVDYAILTPLRDGTSLLIEDTEIVFNKLSYHTFSNF